MQVLHFWAVGARVQEAKLRHVVVGKRHREAVAEFAQRFVVELLLLMRAHLALAPETHAVALLGLREDHGRLALVLQRRPIGGVDLHRVVAAAVQPVDVRVAHASDEIAQLGVLVEEVLAIEAPVGGSIHLEFPVHRLVQAL